MDATLSALAKHANGMANQDELFADLFSAEALIETFEARFAKSSGKGVDRVNGTQYARFAEAEFKIVSQKCIAGTFRFSPYLENLKPKGRKKFPRVIGIPTIRDRVVLSQLNKFLAAVFPDCVPKSVASMYVRTIAADLRTKAPHETWVCGTDIKTFYDSIQRDRLLQVLKRKVSCGSALRLTAHALSTPTVPSNTPRSKHASYQEIRGVPQGLAISNLLASIYMQEVDDAMGKLNVTYFRYVDDVLMYGSHDRVNKAYKSLRARLRRRGLSLHKLGEGKSYISPLASPFGYLGYVFEWPAITVRDTTVERFLQTIAAKFSEYVHDKHRRLKTYTYLSEERLKEIFVLELNERITGAISESRRYGWIAYFNQINDLSLLARLDLTISSMFTRLADFNRAAPAGLKKLSRAYYEMRYRPDAGYVHNYDKITERAHKLKFLAERGRLGPKEQLTDDEIHERFDLYRRRVLSDMHADEGVVY